MTDNYRSYAYYTFFYFLAIASIFLLFFGIGAAFEISKYTLLITVLAISISLVAFHYINKIMGKLDIPGWYKYLNLFFWCVIIAGLGAYYNA
jgi:Mn2+/Fe2+ NRAMP family transporter